MDKYRIENHKLTYHPERVLNWLKGEETYPLYIEITPFGGCNHRCIFCALDYLKYKPASMDSSVLKKFLKDISGKGVKSIMFAGEGEPLLHRDIAGVVVEAKENGLDTAITTNGVLLNRPLMETLLPRLSWLRISLNAATPENYASIHRTRPEDFDTVLENIREAVRIKKDGKYSCAIGVQFLLLNENHKEAPELAGAIKEIGADYLAIKPYSQHPSSVNRLKPQLNYDLLMDLEKKLEGYGTDDFNIIFRKKAMLKISQALRPYKKCMGLPFWAYLASSGDLYACSAFLGNKDFCYGNIYKKSFKEIWRGQKRKELIRMMDEGWDIDNCREVCRLDEVNRYLWSLKNPPAHVNFV